MGPWDDPPLIQGVTEGFHNKMETISCQAYGFRNPENYRQRVPVLCINCSIRRSGRGEWIRTTDLLVPNQARTNCPFTMNVKLFVGNNATENFTDQRLKTLFRVNHSRSLLLLP